MADYDIGVLKSRSGVVVKRPPGRPRVEDEVSEGIRGFWAAQCRRHGITREIRSYDDLTLAIAERGGVDWEGSQLLFDGFDYESLHELDLRDYGDYASRLLGIIDEGSRLVTLKFNRPQMVLHEARLKDLGDRGFVRLNCLKSRRLGVSTYSEGATLHLASTQPFWRAGIMAHDAEGTAYLFDMIKLMCDCLPGGLSPGRKRSNRRELLFSNEDAFNGIGLHSGILVQTGGADVLGRAKGFHGLHLSELAWWDNPEKSVYGLAQALSHEPGTFGLVETTANGFNYYKDFWEDSCLQGRAGWNGWVPVFLSWLLMGDYRLGMDRYKEVMGRVFDEGLDEYEGWLVDGMGADLEQIAWRRFMLRHKLDNDIYKWKQEFPCTPEEAFISTGGMVFSIDGLKAQRLKEVAVRRGELSVLN